MLPSGRDGDVGRTAEETDPSVGLGGEQGGVRHARARPAVRAVCL